MSQPGAVLSDKTNKSISTPACPARLAKRGTAPSLSLSVSKTCSRGSTSRSSSGASKSSGGMRWSSQQSRSSISPSPPRPQQSKQASSSVFTKVPLRLPRPPLACITNPHVDLPAHLSRHGMAADADNLRKYPDLAVDYVLRTWTAQIAPDGAASLLESTRTLFDKYGDVTGKQFGAHGVPRELRIPTSLLHQDDLRSSNSLPTHILAVHSLDATEKGILVPCHAFTYVLQGVSLPAFYPSIEGATQHLDDDNYSLLVIPVKVPRPKEFLKVHRYLYTHDTEALLNDLLPIQTIIKRLAKRGMPDTDSNFSNMDMIAPPTLPEGPALDFGGSDADSAKNVNAHRPLASSMLSMAEALSHLQSLAIFELVHRIHAVWANGVAIGILDQAFWRTLDHAWALLVAAMAAKKGRLLDLEMHGLDVDLKKMAV